MSRCGPLGQCKARNLLITTGDVIMETQKYPAYLQAIEDAVKLFGYGDIISYDWLYENFKIEKMQIGTAERFKELQIEFMVAIDKFKDELLLRHSMLLKNVRGVGYQILQPMDHSYQAVFSATKGLTKVIRKLTKEINTVNMNMLTSDEKKEHNNNCTRAATFYAFKKTRKTLEIESN